MEAKCCLFVFLCVFVLSSVQGQVASMCRPNERLLMCGGCQKTCLNPAPDCKGVCKPGCYCNDDEVRNATGNCVKLSQCPSLPASLKLDTTEPRPTRECPNNEEYRFCEPCNKTCDNPRPICPAQCARGCFCKEGLVRDKDGKCVTLKNCSKSMQNEIPHKKGLNYRPIPYKLTCGPNQVFKECENCEKTCSSPNPPCPAQCTRGCFCKDGLVKAPSGECVYLENCPKGKKLDVDLSKGGKLIIATGRLAIAGRSSSHRSLVFSYTILDDYTAISRTSFAVRQDAPLAEEVSLAISHEPTVEDCEVDEEYFSCGCEISCSEQTPQCPEGACMTGCLCSPPLLRHRSGRCVEEEECRRQTCTDPNEEFVCRYGCEPSCDRPTCGVRARRCSLACTCKMGLLRDTITGKCVELEHCNMASVNLSLNKL